jgi:hypothetical protein
LFRLLALLGMLMAAALVGAPAGQAATEPWGVLGHFGETESELRFPEAAFGVDPTSGNVWVVDVELNSSKEEELRIKDFTAAGTLVASRTIEPNEAEVEKTEAFRQAVGIAFDASKERAYVLIDEESSKTPKEEPAASELLAFSTKPSGTKIEPASGVTNGVLVPRATTKLTGSPIGKKEFSPTATEKAALLEPGGIAVNPVTHQVLITGWVGAEKPELWAITETGEITKIWDDNTGAFEECCMSSPVVTKTGKILVLGDKLQEVTELPSDLNSNTAPKRVFWLPRSGECSEKEFNKEPLCPFVEKLTAIVPPQESGGAMSIGPEGSLFLHLKVKNASEGGFQDGAVMVVNENFEETGWIGAGSWGAANKACAVNEANPGNLGPALIAGYQGKAFMFERGDRAEQEHAKVLELGAGGDPSSCPKASATKPKAEVGGVPLTSVPIASTVTFSSELTQANALSTEWEFEAGVAAQVVNERQQEKTLVEHQFAKAGPATITEKITTDDLASPLVTVSETINLIAPVVTKEEVTPEGTSATLKGVVNPMKSLTKCEFQYAVATEPFTGANVQKVPCPVSPGEEERPVSELVKINGLTAGTEYHFRLEPKAGKWEGTEEPGVKWVAPLAGAPGATTLPATEVGVTGATLNGEVKPEASSATCTFEYGPTTSYGKSVSCGTLPSGTTFAHVSAAITGLTGGTPYHYRVVAKNASGTTPGTDLTLTTNPAPMPPTAETLSATGITQAGATLKGLVDPNGEATTCRFEYGTSTGYGSTAPCPTAPGSGRSGVEEALAVGGLASGTPYHYRLVAESPIGKSTGSDKTFTTGAVSAGPGPTSPGETGPKQNVLPSTTVSPTVKVAATGLSVAANGAFSIKLSCIAGATSCAGTVTIKTLSAVAARSAHAAKKAILTLATATFSIAGGKLKTLSLHLNSKAKKLLAKLHTVRARVTIVSHDSQGHSQTTTAVVTLKAAKKK